MTSTDEDCVMCECGHAAEAHRVGDEDGGPGPCRECVCSKFVDARLHREL